MDLGGQRQAPLLPLGLAGESLLLLADVNARRVHLVVAARLENVERLAKLGHVCDARAIGFLGSKGHETQDDPVRGARCEQRHGGQV
jgi:hypothetical protein